MRVADGLRKRDALVYADQKRVLNGGSGPRGGRTLHSAFRGSQWQEIRIDIDPATQPDIIGSITDMRSTVPNASFDAVWSSHSLEHLHAHEVPIALAEFRRTLRPGGFALITCPDLTAVAAAFLQHGPDYVAYVSPMGPITPLDMIFGHGGAIAAGNAHMAHKTGFTAERLGGLLVEAGFTTVITETERYDLWALAVIADADLAAIRGRLRAAGFDMFAEAA